MADMLQGLVERYKPTSSTCNNHTTSMSVRTVPSPTDNFNVARENKDHSVGTHNL
ncbi:hypothetical protein CI610_02439 [invertebrate metagenome]|uniref:Uncharacterized protein n=1 Tax=invertebrate metagenome TaxID=1711999 RepID=A0A2H9T5Z2_9ZZZZ